MTDTKLDHERAELLETLGKHRELFRHTVAGLTDEQAALTPTASELCLGGLIKHVAFVESRWVDFIVEGTAALEGDGDDDYLEHANSFRMLPGETLAGVLESYAEVARRTDELAASLPDLGASHPLPTAPWFEPGASWSARRTLVHIVAETAQHAGHADILREQVLARRTV